MSELVFMAGQYCVFGGGLSFLGQGDQLVGQLSLVDFCQDRGAFHSGTQIMIYNDNFTLDDI